MDQCVVLGANSIAKMLFDGHKCQLNQIYNKNTLYFIVGDLNSSKDTITILKDLQSCFQNQPTETQVINSCDFRAIY